MTILRQAATILFAVTTATATSAQALSPKHVIHRSTVTATQPVSTDGGLYDGAGRPIRTVQPRDDGQGALAPNGYRGPGTASGGPAGGLDNGGP